MGEIGAGQRDRGRGRGRDRGRAVGVGDVAGQYEGEAEGGTSPCWPVGGSYGSWSEM